MDAQEPDVDGRAAQVKGQFMASLGDVENSWRMPIFPGLDSAILLMSPEEYLKQRVTDQIRWHDRQASGARRFNRILTIASLAIGGVVGFLTRFPSLNDATAAVSAIGIFVGGLMAFEQYRERWVQYRRVSEALASERVFFLTRQGPYAGEDCFGAFVAKVESILSQGFEDFSRRASAMKEDGKV